MTAPAANARRMNSLSSMRVGGVVPLGREGAGRPVEDDAAAHEDEALHDLLDGAELVRHVEGRHLPVVAEAVEEAGKRLLRLSVDARGRLVQDEQRGLAGERLGDERPLLLAAGQLRQRTGCLLGEPDVRDGRIHDRAVA